jgi:hypothetical protein
VTARGLALIAAALALSAGLIGVQLAAGGADFVPQRPADPCDDRGPTSTRDLEGLVETVVLTGLDETACKLGVSRERLLLAMLSKEDRAQLAREAGTDERGLAEAIKEGLHAAVARLERNDRLPAAPALARSVAGEIGIPQGLVDLIPDGVLNALPPTADVLNRSIDNLDVNGLFADLDDRKSLEPTLRKALIQGALDEIEDRIRDALPGPLAGLFG